MSTVCMAIPVSSSQIYFLNIILFVILVRQILVAPCPTTSTSDLNSSRRIHYTESRWYLLGGDGGRYRQWCTPILSIYHSIFASAWSLVYLFIILSSRRHTLFVYLSIILYPVNIVLLRHNPASLA